MATNEKHREVLTTGQVAKICKVAPRTVSKWFDSGQLRGYRIPGSKDRRIPVDHLVRFMKNHGIPTAGLVADTISLIVVDADAQHAHTLRDVLVNDEAYEVYLAATAFDAGALAQKYRPDVIVVDMATTDVDPGRLCQAVRASAELNGIRLLAVGGGLDEGQGQGLLQQGFAGYLAKPFEIRQLVELVERIMEK